MSSDQQFYYNIESDKIYLLKFCDNWTVIAASTKGSSLEEIVEFLKDFNCENPSTSFARGSYISDGTGLYLHLKSGKGYASFDAEIKGNKYFIFEIQNHVTGKRVKRTYYRSDLKTVLDSLKKRNIEKFDRSSALPSSVNANGPEVNTLSTIKQKLVGFLAVTAILFLLFTCASRKRYGATCWDGTGSTATGSGAFSHHGGVMHWRHKYWWD